MKRIALLFAGQGDQTTGMGRDLAQAFPAAAAVVAQADAALGRPLSTVMYDGPQDELTQTKNCQPALYTHGLAALAALRAVAGDFPVHAAAGLSLGEFTAHAAAGTFDFATGAKLVARRGQFMQEACEATQGGMAAMIGGDESAVVQLAADCDVDAANFNCPGQIVLSGEREKITRAVGLAKERGIRIAKALDVAGAYHSRLMISAREKLGAELAATAVASPRFPVICNVAARPVGDAADIRATLEAQVTGSVRWTQCIEYLLDQEGVGFFLEFGPKTTLSGLLGRIRKGVPCESVCDVPTLEKAAAALKAWLAA